MPRPRKPAPQSEPTAMVASAARIVAGRRKNVPTGTSAWQAEVWQMLDQVGELEFYREWVANAMSRCELYVVEVQEDGTEVRLDEGLAVDALDALFGGSEGQAEMLSAMGSHLSLPGETWLVGLLDYPDDPDLDMWRTLSRDEVKEQGKGWQINRGDGEPEVYAAEDVFVARIWRPHPRLHVEAHSSVRSALPILRELVGLSKHTAAAIDSRLAGAGLLLLPAEVTFASPANPDDDPEDPNTDPLIATLTEAMITAIEDRGDASALVPIIIKAAGEHLEKIRHITFATPLSDEARELRSELLTRLARSLDVPAEVLTGMGDVNHWTGWLLDESAIKMHVEPLLSIATNGLTTRYLWPCMQGAAETMDPADRRFRLRGSTEKLRQRPNRSDLAQTSHAGGTITDEAWARETGFDKADLLDATSDEFRRRALMRLAMNSSIPEVIVGALAALGVQINLPVPATPPEVTPVQPDAPQAVEAPVDRRGTPDPAGASPERAATLLAVGETMVFRALERGWNRGRGRGGATTRRAIPADRLEAALDGAWTNVDRVAALHGVDPARLRDTLHAYTSDLLQSGDSHNPRQLSDLLVRRVLSDRVPELA